MNRIELAYTTVRMASHEMFLAMMLTNAKREEAQALILTVNPAQTRIDLILLDGSSRGLQPPPPEVLLSIMESLEQGQIHYKSKVYSATINKVEVQRGVDSMTARISNWSIECD